MTAKNSPKNTRQENLKNVEMRTNDTSEFSPNGAVSSSLNSDQQRIIELEKLLADANARAKKPARTATVSLEKQAEREAKRIETEAARVAKQAEFEAELVARAERIQSELIEQLSTPCSLQQLQDILAHYTPQVRIAKPSKKTASTVTSEGSTIAVNGVVYKNKMYWKETHHLTDEEVLAIVAEANRQSAEGKLNKSAIGRMFNAHGAMISNILDGSYYSDVTGIPKPAKKG